MREPMIFTKDQALKALTDAAKLERRKRAEDKRSALAEAIQRLQVTK